MFDIPICLLLFKRTATLERIIGRINEVNPRRVYLLADGGRTPEEHAACIKCREYAESLFNADIEIITHYADQNIGVFRNIGLGARWVFEREEKAIFIEDDNLPAVSFFAFCKELLEKYNDTENVLWVCGTNYLGRYASEYSYVFTRHMLPCGWASWSHKFLKHYDGYLDSIEDKEKRRNFKRSYLEKGCKSLKLYYTQLYPVERTRYLTAQHINQASWDYQMNYSVRSNLFYGISPAMNQINNIGVDELSTHGGTVNVGQIEDFCNIQEENISFPLIHPEEIKVDEKYERAINRILAKSWASPIKHCLARPIKKLIGINQYDSFSQWRKNKK